jgi:ABC-2 type transport system permease protein
MLGRIALFELRYQLRRGITWVSLAIFGLLSFTLITLIGLEPTPIPMNSPGRIAFIYAMFGIFGMFLSIATIADVALRDANSGMDAILRVQPIRTSVHYGPRFAGAYVVAVLAFMGVVLGYAAGAAMPWVADRSAGVFQLQAHAIAVVVMVLPTMFATGALFFTIATLTRRLMATYLGAFALLILLVAVPYLMNNPDYRTLAVLLDPFGVFAFLLDTDKWTTAERATRQLPLDGMLMWNRLLWIGIGLVLLSLSFALFSARERRPLMVRVNAPLGATPRLSLERPAITAGHVNAWDQLVLRTRHETRSILRSWTFIVLLILGLLAASGVLFVLYAAGIKDLATTPVVAHAMSQVFWLVTVLIPITYGGELIWRDRNAKIAQIIDATVAPNVIFLLSKIIAVALVVFALLAVGMISGIVFQLIMRAESIDVGYYLLKLILVVGLPALMYGVLAILIQTVVNRKFVGLLLMLAVLGLMAFADELHIDRFLHLFAIPDPGMVPGYEVFGKSLWFAGYWTGIAVLIAIASYLIWVRGAASLWTRLARAHRSITPRAAVIALLALGGAAATGGYIYWEPYTIGTGFASARPQSAPAQPGWGAEKLITR